MLQIRRSNDRGKVDIGWLQSRHSFSFGEYYDPKHMGFSVLRVINDDVVAPGQGFATHGHANMEIITYVTQGKLQHEDSMGNGGVIAAGDVQRMSAGSGARHSEYNPSQEESVRLLQIWIEPELENVTPSYAQKHFADTEKRNRLCLLVSGDGRDGSLSMHQAVELYAGIFDAGLRLNFDLRSGRQAWLQIVRGKLDVEGEMLHMGDGAAFSDIAQLRLHAVEETEFLLFDLP